MKRKELLQSKEYWLGEIQIEIFNHLNDYMKEHNLNKKELAKKLGFSRKFISRILNGNCDCSITKMVELYLAIGKVPKILIQNIESQL